MIAELVKDVHAAGLPFDPDLSFPCPVRVQSALYVALGHVCERCEAGEDLWPLRARLLGALRWIEALGRRSRWASWFR